MLIVLIQFSLSSVAKRQRALRFSQFHGNDLGGNGVWAIGLRHPDYFAALAPISGYFSYPFEIPYNVYADPEIYEWLLSQTLN